MDPITFIGAASTIASVFGLGKKDKTKKILQSQEINAWRQGVQNYLDSLRSIKPSYVAANRVRIRSSFGQVLADKMGIQNPEAPRSTSGAIKYHQTDLGRMYDSDPSNQ